MNIAEAKSQIKDTVDAYLSRDDTGSYEIPPQAQRPLFLLGAPGIGKTAVVGQVADELSIGLVSYSMTHHTRQSALGLPFIVHKDYQGQEFDISEYTMSEIIASMYDYMERTGHERGILFLDEINCVSETLYPSMLQFLQFKTFGRHRVPDGWVVVCAGNPPEYNKSVYDFDVVTLDRLRKIVVEPDLAAWLEYANATGVHPAVISYLQVKRDHFYAIESSPSGKSFVTARGWDDLSRVMKLFEKKGKTVDRALVEQFLQDDDIAERFAQYYALFSRYRADYRVGEILQGAEVQDALERAGAARLDERFALVRLLLDALDSRMARIMERERAVAVARDALRSAKPGVLEGRDAAEALEDAAEALARDAKRTLEAGAAGDAAVRPDRAAVRMLRDYALACQEERAGSGESSFQIAAERYRADVEDFRAQVEEASAQLGRAFSFLAEAFGDGREMSAFVAELASRPAMARFVAAFGSDEYRARSAAGASDGHSDLERRIAGIDLDAALVAQALERARQEAERACAACSGC